MRLRDFTTHIVNDGYRNFVILQLRTDEGIVGLGEGTVEWAEQAARSALDQLCTHILGEDPMDSESLTVRLLRDSYWPDSMVISSAVSAINQALWDIRGKSLGRPLVELIGGRVDTPVRVYANTWFGGCTTPEEFAARAKDTVAAGFTALKWDPFSSAHGRLERAEAERALANVAAVRAAVGPDVDLLIECHGRLSYGWALPILTRFQEFGPLLIEEPLLPDQSRMLRALTDAGLPISTGERLCSLNSFRVLLEETRVPVLQPDVCHALGVSGLLKVAALAEAHQAVIAPHNSVGPIGNTAALHVAAAIPNALIFEYLVSQPDWIDDVFPGAPKPEAGFIRPPAGPGLGVGFREEIADEHPHREYWQGMSLFSDDRNKGLPAARLVTPTDES